jgi:hypothetical protein
MSKLFVITVLALFGNHVSALALKQHPVRHDLYQEIKVKAARWSPADPADNYFRDIPVHKL